MRKISILLGFFFFFFVSSIEGAPARQGSTGNILTPSADVLRAGQASVGFFHQQGDSRITFGLGIDNRWELSANEKTTDKDTAINFKYMLQPEGILKPGFAIGIDDVGAQEQRSHYAVLSKGLPFGIRMHAGYGDGQYGGVFLAVEKKLMPKVQPGIFPDTSLFIEDNGHISSLGLRMALSRGSKLEFGRRDGHSFVGFSYNYY